MSRTYARLLLGIAVSACAWAGSFEVRAADCFRRLGIGYGAGYHAPAPFTKSPTLARLPGWAGWKGECCQPGGTPTGTGCLDGASPAPTCPSCAPQVPAVGGDCGCGSRWLGGCSLPPRTYPRPGPGVY